MSEIPLQEKSQQPQFTIQAFYLRHSSLETGISPRLLRSGLTPEMKLELRVQINPLEKEDEVVLDLTITARDGSGSSLLYLIKIHQAGCFTLTNFTPEQKAFFLNTTCANLIYPYACHKANTLAVEAGFPPVNLLPIDFAHLYAQQQKQQVAQNISTDKVIENPTPASSMGPNNKWAGLATSNVKSEDILT